MKRKWRNQLSSAFYVPKPQGKEKFLSQFERPQLSFGKFLGVQLCYMRKWNFVYGTVIFVLSIWSVHHMEKQFLWGISALVPYLSMLVATETGRSVRYKMEELELVAKFSLKSVVIARIGILGLSNLVLLGIVFPFVCNGEDSIWFHTGIYLLIPYLLSAFLNLYILRRCKREESIYLCLGITIMVSGIYMIFQIMQVPLSIFNLQKTWGGIFLFSLCLVGCELWKMIKSWEEYVWN